MNAQVLIEKFRILIEEIRESERGERDILKKVDLQILENKAFMMKLEATENFLKIMEKRA